METQKLIPVLLLLAVSPLRAQTPADASRRGLLRGQANLAGGYLFAQKSFGAYIAGDADLYLGDRVSVTGELWYGIPTDNGPLRQNHAIFAGFNYHPLKHPRWDPYVGFSPGMALVRVRYDAGDGPRSSPFTPVPQPAVTAGCNWYLGTIFHLFVKVRWVHGQMMGAAPFPTPLHELKISGGLGWNLRVMRKKPSARGI